MRSTKLLLDFQYGDDDADDKGGEDHDDDDENDNKDDSEKPRRSKSHFNTTERQQCFMIIGTNGWYNFYFHIVMVTAGTMVGMKTSTAVDTGLNIKSWKQIRKKEILQICDSEEKVIANL